jgi:hypothetical protein
MLTGPEQGGRTLPTVRATIHASFHVSNWRGEHTSRPIIPHCPRLAR